MSADGRLEMQAGLAGMVVLVPATAGEPCAAGDVLAVVEAMKLEIPVLAAADGTIVEVLAAPGQAVAENDVIAVIEKAGPA